MSHLKYPRSCPVVQTSNLTQIRYLPGSLKNVFSVLIPIITNIVNLSLSSGNFHSTPKESVVSPLLKKTYLKHWRSVKLPPYLQPVSHLQNNWTCCKISNNHPPTYHLIIFLIHTSLPTLNIIPLKLLFCTFTIISSMPLIHNKYHVSVFLTCLLPLTLYIRS